MKISIIALGLLAATLPCSAEFRNWTNTEGQTAELELKKVKESDGEKVGVFKMKNGKTVHLKTSQLAAEDAKFMADWQPSVFEASLEGNLVKLKGDKFAPHTTHECPEKYYVFYYTAYWCPPCRAFTPSLVKWYKANKNENFELVLVSSDRKPEDMLAYAKDKKMPWPQLALTKSRDFKSTHNHGVRGIPALIVCDLEGKNLGNFRSKLDELTKLVK